MPQKEKQEVSMSLAKGTSMDATAVFFYQYGMFFHIKRRTTNCVEDLSWKDNLLATLSKSSKSFAFLHLIDLLINTENFKK